MLEIYEDKEKNDNQTIYVENKSNRQGKNI